MKIISELILSLLLIPLAGISLSAGTLIKIKNVDVSSFPRIGVTAAVQDSDHRFIQGLDESDFMVYEDGYRAGYVKAECMRDPEEQIHLVFCVDSSRSISPSFLEDIKAAAAGILFSPGSPQEQIALYRFNDSSELLKGFGTDRKEIQKAVDSISRHGTKTRLYNVIYDAIQLLEDAGARNRAVIVFTDGKDEGSSITVRDILNFSKDTNTSIFFISRAKGKEQQVLDRMARLTGGQLVFCGQRADIAGMYSRILSLVRSRYLISYESHLQPDNKNHRLEVRLSHGELRDRDTVEFPLKKGMLPSGFLQKGNIFIFWILGLLLLALVIILVLALRQKTSKKDVKSQADDAPAAAAGLASEDTSPRMEEVRRTIYSNAWLIQKDGSSNGKKFNLFRTETTLGRDPECGLVIYDNTVSLVHAKIKRISGAYYLFDLISDTGTFLNGKKLLRPKPLFDWDEIAIGRARFVFRGSKLIR